MTPTPVPVAVRAYTERVDQPHRSGSPRVWQGWPDDVLVFDTETTTDALQRLTFGSWRQYRWLPDGSLECVAEGLFHDDDLATRDPEGYAALKRYAARRKADVAEGRDRHLTLRSRWNFLWDVFRPLAYSAHALVVGFNLPFDLTRLAASWGEARGRFYGGFSLVLWQSRVRSTGELVESRYLPRLWIKPLDSKRSFMQFATVAQLDPRDAEVTKGPDGRVRYLAFPGNFLDLRTLAFALSNESHSLASACRAFGVTHGKIHAEGHGRISEAYIDYNRRDVLATAELLVALRREFDAHPIGLDPCKAYSPATIAKAYMRAMGITLPFRQFADLPRELSGIAMSAYYGGRAEAHVRKVPLPVVHTDFVSMYPTVNSLMGLSEVLTAESLAVEPYTEEAQALLDHATADRYFDPAAWRGLQWFAEIQPTADVVPTRAQYDPASPGFNIAVSTLTTPHHMWYAGPDLVASALLAGHAPRVLRAVRLVPHGRQTTLRAVKFGGVLPIDPAREDIYRAVVEQRKRAEQDRRRPAVERRRIAMALKVVANSGGYGVMAELNREDLPKDETVPIRVHARGTSFEATTSVPESPGEYCFPPSAALITAGARLMLALLEHEVTAAGGTYVFCDTDSMAIVATKRGGLVPCVDGSQTTRRGERAVRALSWAQVAAIVARFERLNPYDRNVVPKSILDIKSVNFDEHGVQQPLFIYAIAAKRYTFFRVGRRGKVEIIEPSEHGLGHLINPLGKGEDDRDWIRLVWAHIVAEALGVRPPPIPFRHLPALGRIGITSPHLLRPIADAQSQLPIAERIRPCSFLLTGSVRPFGHPVGVDPTQFHLVRPFVDDAREAVATPWTNKYTGEQYAVTTSDRAPPDVAVLKSYGDVLDAYRVHPEPKSANRRGLPCDRRTVGLLYRREIGIESLELHGKEAHRVEDVQAGIVRSWAEVVSKYLDPTLDPWKTDYLPKLRLIPRDLLAERAAISVRAIRAIVNGHSLPSDRTRALLLEVLADPPVVRPKGWTTAKKPRAARRTRRGPRKRLAHKRQKRRRG